MNLISNSPVERSLRTQPREVCITQIGFTVSSLKPQLLGCGHCVCVPACVCVRACVYACMCACMHACVRVCILGWFSYLTQ